MTTRRTLLAAGAMLALGWGGAPAGAQDIRIGAVLSVTGPASFLGDPEEKTLKLYVDEINKAGGVNGRKLHLIVYDDGGDANRARTFATRLVEEDKVIAMVGGTTTGTTMAMVPVFEDAQIPFISLAGAVVIIEPVKRWVFKTPHTDRMACEKIFDDLKKRNLTRVAMISGTDGFGKSMRDECMKVNARFGIEIIHEETYGPRDTDMTPQLTNIRARNPQAVINPGFGQGPAIVTRNYRQLGITAPLYQSHGVASKQFIELAGDAANGVRLPAAALLVADKLPDSDPQKPVALAYKRKFEETFRQPVSTFGGHAYDGLFILVEAMKRAGTTLTPARIRDEIERTRGFMGTAGIFNMSPTDHMGLDLSAFKMLEIRNGDWALADGATN